MRIRLGIVACLLSLAAGGLSQAAVRVALLEARPNQTSPIVALLLPKLTAGDKFTVIERQQIDKVLGEQQLSALLGSKAMASRISIGKLLQADLLVFVQPGTGSQPQLEVSISETHHGLRLVRQTVDPTSGEHAAAAVYKLIDESAIRQAQQIDEIFAVPPFVNDDLGFDFDYLKGAYARLVEGVVFEQKGVLIADLDEARSIAQEITLSNAADVARPLPLYVLGSFRNDGAKGDRRVRITLKLMRGEAMVSSITQEGLAPDQVPAVLRDATASFLAKSTTASQPTADPRIEAAQLADRAHLMLSCGSWTEAMDLAEASLLLNPHQPAMHRDVLAALAQSESTGFAPSTLPPGTKSISYSPGVRIRRGLVHLEPYLDETTIDYQRDKNLVAGTLGALARMKLDSERRLALFGPNGPGAADCREFAELRRFAQAMYDRVLDDKSQRRVPDDTTMFLGDIEFLGGMRDDQTQALNLKVLSQFAYLPNEGRLLSIMRAPPEELNDGSRPNFRKFLSQARELPNADLRKQVDARLQMLDSTYRQWQARKEKTLDRSPQTLLALAAQSNPDDDVKLIPVALKSDGTVNEASMQPIQGWLAAGPGIDVAWSQYGIYVMKQPGVLRQLDDRLPAKSIYRGVRPVFDGKYVWFVHMAYSENYCKLLAINPSDETSIEIDADDGLPKGTRLELAPLDAGRVVVVGNFGQAYAAIVQLMPKPAPKGAKISILHEFRSVPAIGDKEQWRNGDLIFDPADIRVLKESTADGAPRQIALVRRGSKETSLVDHPILIDLKSGAVRVIDDKHGALMPANLIATQDGACFQIIPGGNCALWRVGIPTATEHRTGLHFHYIHQLIEADGAMYCLGDGNDWGAGVVDRGPFRALKVKLPRTERGLTVARSEHYGLVGWFNQRANGPFAEDFKFYRIEIAKPVHDWLAELQHR